MILHIPHSGTETLKRNISKNDINELTDWFTDELFHSENSDRIICTVSRFVCDVERLPDENEPMFKRGQGICYTKGTKNNDIEVFDKSWIIENIYAKHHLKLNNIIRKSLTMFPLVVIVDCHSFTPFSKNDPDFCLGINEDYPKILVKAVKTYLLEQGYSVKINVPYSGSIHPTEFKNDNRIQSIMIEVNKDLYLTKNFKKSKDFEHTKKIINNVLEIISKYEIEAQNEI